MKKLIRSLTILCILSNLAYAQEQERPELTSPGTLTVNIFFPKIGKSQKSRPAISTEPVAVGERVNICLQIYPASGKHISTDGYKAEYYLDNLLIHEQETVFESKKGHISYIFELDTTAYEPGIHTLIVNLWDKHTAVGIGIKKISVQPLGINNQLR